MKQFFKYALPGFLLLSIIVACEKEYESIEAIDERNVNAYIQQNNLNVTEHEDTGVFYEILEPGTGEDLEYSDQLPLIFTIRSLDGKYSAIDTFSNANRYYNYLGYFNMEGVRVLVKEVLKKRQGRIRMIVPSRLAFGRNGAGDIPGNASLDFTLRVLDEDKMDEYDDGVIQNYLSANNLSDFTRTESGLYYKITDPGTGSPISIDSTVVADYTGKLLNGDVFDSGNGASFSVAGVVKGWQEAIPLIKQGGSIRIILPSSLGYGLAGSSPIPPFSCLDFTVKITDVK